MVNRNDLIAYLLHEMPEAERLDFAEQWFTDADLNSQLLLAEAELLDAYVRGQLSGNQRTRVQRYLLNSPEQDKKLQFAAALHGLLPSRRAPRFHWAAICAAAVFLILVGSIVWMAQQNRALRSEIANLPQTARPASGGIYSASLLAGGLRGLSTQRAISLPQSARILRLELELSEEDRHARFSATLSVSGRSVWQEEPLRLETRGQAFFTTVWIPAETLQSGKYTLLLRADGNPVAYYNFTLIR